jgi:hypothetical protein
MGSRNVFSFKRSQITNIIIMTIISLPACTCSRLSAHLQRFILNENHVYLTQSFRVGLADLTIVNEALIALSLDDITSRTQKYIVDNQVCRDHGLRICPHGTVRFAGRIFKQFEYFSKHCRKNSSFIKIGRE